jgi:6-phosphogluconolactonase
MVQGRCGFLAVFEAWSCLEFRPASRTDSGLNQAMAFELIPLANAGALAVAAAAEWLKDVEARQVGGKPYCVALSGGRIARGFASAVAELARARNPTLDPVQFFWSDERCVPPDDPESNFSIAQELIFLTLGIPAQRIHRIRGEAEAELAAREAETELRRVAVQESEGQPVLDLAFLGMGEEGHVASLFPGEPEAVLASPAVFRPVVVPKPPPQRITLGYPALAAARQVWVLVSGVAKQGALRESLAPTGRTPLARVLRLRSQTRIFTDIQL